MSTFQRKWQIKVSIYLNHEQEEMACHFAVPMYPGLAMADRFTQPGMAMYGALQQPTINQCTR